MKFRYAVATAGAVFVIVSVFIGGAAFAKSSSPAQWAPKFCGAFTTWQTTTDANVANLQNSLSGSGTASDARTLIANYFATDAADTDTFVAALTSAGAPSLTNGTKIQNTLAAAFRATRDDSAAAQMKAQQLPIDDVATFQTQGEALLTAYQKTSQNIDKSLKTVDKLDVSGKLTKALKNEPACASLSGSSSTATSSCKTDKASTDAAEVAYHATKGHYTDAATLVSAGFLHAPPNAYTITLTGTAQNATAYALQGVGNCA